MLRKLFAILFTSAVLTASICGCTDSLANSTPVSSTNSITSNTSGSTVTTQENTSASRPSSAPSDSVSTGKKNALKSAEQYLNVMAFSYSGLIDQLEYEGYTAEEAEYAAKNCGADWNEQAVLSAKQYLKTMSFSKDGLIEQLEYEGYSHEQAVYGAEQAYSSASDTAAAANSSSSGSATVGEQNALQSALQYLNSMPFSYTGLIGQLEYEGYSDSEAKYAAELTSTGEVLNRVASDPAAVGYISLASVSPSIKAVKVDGVEATDENIVNGTYKVSRPFIQIYKKGTDSELVKAWFDFVKSDEGKQVIEDVGLIPAE